MNNKRGQLRDGSSAILRSAHLRRVALTPSTLFACVAIAGIAVMAAYCTGVNGETTSSSAADDSAAFAQRRLELPPSPAGKDLPNPMDRLLAPYFAQHNVTSDQLVSDEVYARRVYLDCIGLIPMPEDIETFVADQRPDKRERLVDTLLAQNHHYALHWLTFWNDALRNDYQGTGYTDGGRKQITSWLYHALADNMPFDQFVRELVNPGAASDGFIKGIVWRGVVNASQVPQIQAAQNISQVFLGINLKCASCHDSFINQWKLNDAYGLASIFSDRPIEVHHCDHPTGEFSSPKFLYSGLGAIDKDAPRAERLKQLAEIISAPANGRLSRTMVNRLWARFFGRGLVEPVDDMDAPCWNRDLLDWLATDFADRGFDVKKTIALIATSRAYQMPVVAVAEAEGSDKIFRGPQVRRLSAEQLVDAVTALTGVSQKNFSAPLGEELVAYFENKAKNREGAAILASSKSDTKSVSAETRPIGPRQNLVCFVSDVIRNTSVELDLNIEGAHTLWLIVTEGEKTNLLDWADWGEPHVITADGITRLTDLPWKSASNGLAKVEINKNYDGHPLRLVDSNPSYGIGTHAPSAIVYDLPPNTKRFLAKIGPDRMAVERSPDGHEMRFVVLTDIEVRSSLASASRLTTALGRPNREQVVTSRSGVATTLEAMELTNGTTLDEMLHEGASRWLTIANSSPGDHADFLVENLYKTALSRKPNPAERQAAADLLGASLTQQGVEDLLWIVVMLPEFQLIH